MKKKRRKKIVWVMVESTCVNDNVITCSKQDGEVVTVSVGVKQKEPFTKYTRDGKYTIIPCTHVGKDLYECNSTERKHVGDEWQSLPGKVVSCP